MTGIDFKDSDYYTGPPVTPQVVLAAEDALGLRLPESYLELVRQRNGGEPVKCRFPTPFATSWAPDHFEIRAILGLGGDWGLDASLGSSYLIDEWELPNIGIVVCAMPSGGHDAVMLDYRRSSPEPAIAYVDEDRIPRVVAATFGEFLTRLESPSD